jgi:hypothetical protein
VSADVRAPAGAAGWTPRDGFVYEPVDLPTRVADGDYVSRRRRRRHPRRDGRHYGAVGRGVARRGDVAEAPATSHVDVVFTGPPRPEPPGFVEVEDDEGRSTRYGQWLQRDDGAGVLRIPAP